jgi:ribosomal protein S18 acetylase RimI-like enzyme
MKTIHAVQSADNEAVIALAEASGLFNAEGLEQIQERLTTYLNGSNEDIWLLASDEQPMGVLYCTPEPMTSGTWNILMLLVHPNAHGQGYGRALIAHIEELVAVRKARLLIVETSGVEDFERTRSFYAQCGYTEEARIRNFYAASDDKVVFVKSLAA